MEGAQVPHVVPISHASGSGHCPQVLRENWRRATLTAGWPFPSDWGVPAVDAVCEAAAEGRDPSQALSWLGRARAQSGAGLGETLHDVAALYGVVRSGVGDPAGPTPVVEPPTIDAVPTRLVRAAALGWADVAAGEVASAQVVDELTGLVTVGYLRTRLGEVYRCAKVAGHRATDSHVLVLLAVDLTRTGGWTRLVPMLMVAEAMRTVFDGGQSLALIGPSVAAALCRRDDQLPLRTKRLRRLATELLSVDPDTACACPVRVWLEGLPPGYSGVCDLLAHLGR